MTDNPAVAPYSAPARPDLLSSPRRVGVLLSHGFTGSPASMRPWGQFLADRGYAVEVPRLPGHGTTWQEMNGTGWDDWYAEVTRAFDKLVAENDQVVVGGLSMGGALALRLAADRSADVRGVVLVNAAVASTNRQLLAVPALKHVLKSMPGIGNDIKKPGADELGYDRTPLRALASMLAAWKPLRTALADVSAPILLFGSTEDHVVDPSSAALIQSTVGSRDVRERLLEDSYHVATLDNDAPTIFEESAEFIERVTAD
ncbi:alpha/beta hydrolase [Nocardioides donggukensis]|uniref:Alpha/beta fold hydrolase n=1 Tax=Nocardioides donggukensis TaxID=2774019 RepID=A0A927K548_9ACTN|nr:alpha/beta fold hydrolase [Nocardioides donggukensis]MBD8869168.1 alpha/beta fold hydrolase [Nocardioides donggukensis]